MNCREIEPLLLAERDGVLTTEQRAMLERHVATCPSCRQCAADLARAMADLRADAANVAVPDVDEEWRTIRAQLHQKEAKPARKRPLAPVIWFGGSLAAAAALALAFFVNRPSSEETTVQFAEIARADFVEAGDDNASTLVYVDKESGWLVVWATDSGAPDSG